MIRTYLSLSVTTVSAASAVAAESSGETTFPPFDPGYFSTQIFWLLISFGILYFVLSRGILRRVGQILEERSDHITDDLDKASRMQSQAREAQKHRERALTDARAEAQGVVEATRQSVDAEIKRSIAAADAQAGEQAEIAEMRIRKMRSEALSRIDEIAADVAQAAIEKVAGKSVTVARIKSVLN
ncbi:MAG: F0F1 ATP synthase subunit B' [Hyphomonadaceae bacterium]|nr:F0F1 ATP synthase subunit B' [Hyphomonadaceae bacterium]